MKPKPDPGYLIAERCACGGQIRTWIEPTNRDYVNDDGEVFRFGERTAKCWSCWSDRKDFVIGLMAQGGAKV